MAGWQEELAELLRELGVTQEEQEIRTLLWPTDKKLMRSDFKRRPRGHEPSAGAFISGDIASDADVAHEAESWLTDLSSMRREVDSIVRQVIHLMQRGDLDKSLKEDVMVVLRALRRRATVTQQAATSDEAYLESAAAMLHFCRLVLRLSETAIQEDL